MDEPKRRARRAQQAQPEETAPQESAQTVQENPAPRRRRAQQALSEPMPAEQPALDAQIETGRNEPPVMDQKEKTGKKTKKKKKNAHPERRMMQALLGAAVLLSMAGAAIVHAAKQIKREHLRLAAMALCACVALVSAWQVGSIVLRSVRTNRLNDSLAQQRAAMIQAQQETDAAASAEMPADGPLPTDGPLPVINHMPTDDPLPVINQMPTDDPLPGDEPVQAAELEQTPAPEGGMDAAPEQPETTVAPDTVRTMKYHQVGGDALPEMAQLHGQNHDLVAWIQIPDVLDLPVVYRDNDYYLKRDFSKQKNASGTIFLDENHPFREKTQNLLLHGHNMKDGTMFGRLAQYLYDDTYLRNHPIIYFDTLWRKEQYVIFAILDVSLKPSDPRFFNYFTHNTFSSDAEFSMYIRQLQLRSRYAIPIDVQPSDALLTLSTCLDEDRLVIVARRLREGETRSDVRTFIRMATKQ